jgi:hypothetical protein
VSAVTPIPKRVPPNPRRGARQGKQPEQTVAQDIAQEPEVGQELDEEHKLDVENKPEAEPEPEVEQELEAEQELEVDTVKIKIEKGYKPGPEQSAGAYNGQDGGIGSSAQSAIDIPDEFGDIEDEDYEAILAAAKSVEMRTKAQDEEKETQKARGIQLKEARRRQIDIKKEAGLRKKLSLDRVREFGNRQKKERESMWQSAHEKAEEAAIACAVKYRREQMEEVNRKWKEDLPRIKEMEYTRVITRDIPKLKRITKKQFITSGTGDLAK